MRNEATKQTSTLEELTSGGALDEDLLPNWYVLDGAPCRWQLLAIIDPEAATLRLVHELWKSPVCGAPLRWCTHPESALLLSSTQTLALTALLASH